MAVIPGGAGRAYGRAAPPRKGVALVRRHRREGEVQCRAGSTRRRQRGSASPPGGNPGPRVRLKATIRPETLRGAVRCRSKKLKGRGAHRPAAPCEAKPRAETRRG